MVSPAGRRALITLARAAVTARVSGRPAPRLADEDLPDLRAGAFVTIHAHGRLRGCIGHVEADRPVAEVVAEMAASAATEDPRFAAILPAELPLLDVEISVLGPLERIDPLDPSQIALGHHGLVIELGRRRGLLLPQVATEWGWDRETFLTQLCAKAALAPDAWRTGATVHRFEAEVFGESDQDA